MALPFTTVRHHSSSSVFLTYIIYSADFCYLVTAQERTGSARQWYTRREHLFPSRVSLARNILYWAHYDIDMILPSAYYAGYSISALAVQEAQKAKHRPYYQLYRQQHSEQAWLCAVSFYFEDFRETWTRKFHHRDFCFLKSPWCVRNPAYLPIKSRERPQIAIIWLFDRCISLNSTYSKMIYYEIGSKRSLRIRKAKWQRRTNYITQATVRSRTRVTPCCQIIQKKSICQNFQHRTYLSSKPHKRFRPIFREYGVCCSEFYLRYRR